MNIINSQNRDKSQKSNYKQIYHHSLQKADYPVHT